ncbi:hypothetical protein LOTGIDRAFT_178023 [Lottia gigantea]|uniref:Uncharacterized protein n=1 Tax=Lottia gigantea TaxID=225164 RepID=V4CDL6_LOTGI|nr:hypothetical protein LOTGIDRAFT_178023 [Lottia gigantea]ESP00015.1 hypothetical protein LOTGIDRAFT_178023 [Lottia gigantea]
MASPTPSQSDTLTTASNSSDSEMESANMNTRCNLCTETFTIPKVLSCFHTYCQPCLEKSQECTEKITCPDCQFDTILGADGLMGLKPDYAVSNILESNALESSALNCTGCKSKETNAVARCFDCANFLCANCVMAHQFMHCFEGHRVLSLGDLQMNKDEPKSDKQVNCPRHRNDILKFFCKTCSQPICKECTVFDHGRGHECQFLMDVAHRQVDMMRHLEAEARSKINDLRLSAKGIEMLSTTLQSQYTKAQDDINDTYNFYRAMLEERKQDSLKELDQAFNTKQVGISTLAQKITESVEKLYLGSEFVDKLIKHASLTEALLLKNFIEQRFQNMFNYLPDLNKENYFELEFVSNFQAIQTGVRNTFGYIRQGNEIQNGGGPKPQPIARPNGYVSTSNLSNGHIFDPNCLTKDFGSSSLIFPPNDTNQYEKWSSGLDILQNGIDVFSPPPDAMGDLTSKLISSSLYPPKSQIRRQKMIYHCRFGEFGVLEGQFTEPSGVAVNAQNDIIVADTNNHRIQIFDKEGRFKFQFGECGKRDGQLLYPNRVSVVKASGDIIVTERSPTHQIQIYNQYGQFVRKFGANVLQHPRGVTVDNKGRIIIVECKVMRVIIFDQYGNVLNKFGCSKHLQFPNSVVVNDKEEIFISDNRAHCVKVFNYQGLYLRQIGGEGVTNYPIGVGINSAGEVLVADNHNNFNLTNFTQDGQLINALESKVKHAQCFDVALMDDGSVVLASKDYKLYIYKYM